MKRAAVGELFVAMHKLKPPRALASAQGKRIDINNSVSSSHNYPKSKRVLSRDAAGGLARAMAHGIDELPANSPRIRVSLPDIAFLRRPKAGSEGR
jgi:hypothetical protein